MAIGVLIADDDPLIRQGLEIILSRDENFQVVGIASNGREALEACLTKKIDVALVDIRMPLLTGIEAVKEISSQTSVKSIILTTFLEDDLVDSAMAAGAKGYILKGISPEEIKSIIKLVHNGSVVFDNGVMEKFQADRGKKKSVFDSSDLTERESEIVQLIAKGLSNKAIAGKLFLSESTVKNYVTSILSKLDLEQRTQIAVYYLTGEKS
ncbi:MAG: response regulator transcription factor [Spirochaetales bacterium]|nr:response regulator transcription factor [Spirochaetales bacterium]